MAFAGGAEHIVTLSATTAGAASTFTMYGPNYLFINDGPNTAYLSVAVTSGTTAGFPIKINESITIKPGKGYLTGVSYITSTSTGAGPTASIRTWVVS